ncbi:MAG: ribosome recycling factor [Proteobacteria bacterium]|nr:ribosome recycling factor [Pseudomonadota bacterium]
MSSQFDNYKAQCAKAIEHFKRDLGRLRSGRATPTLLEGLQVEYYGSMVPLQQLGLVAAPESRMLTIQVYDASAIESIEKAIRQSELGFNPSRDGGLIRIVIPALNEERRKDLIKKVNKMSEETKISLRNLRRDEVENVKKKTKAKEMSEDDSRRAQEEIQKIIDRFIVDVDAAAASKEKELIEV